MDGSSEHTSTKEYAGKAHPGRGDLPPNPAARQWMDDGWVVSGWMMRERERERDAQVHFPDAYTAF